MNQDELRRDVRIAAAIYKDIFIKDYADYLGVNTNSFYNWLNGYYNLSYGKYIKLKGVIDDLLH